MRGSAYSSVNAGRNKIMLGLWLKKDLKRLFQYTSFLIHISPLTQVNPGQLCPYSSAGEGSYDMRARFIAGKAWLFQPLGLVKRLGEGSRSQRALCMPRFLHPLALSQVREEKNQGPRNGSVNQDLIRTLKISLREFSDMSIWTWEATVPIMPERKDLGRLLGIPHGRMLS